MSSDQVTSEIRKCRDGFIPSLNRNINNRGSNRLSRDKRKRNSNANAQRRTNYPKTDTTPFATNEQNPKKRQGNNWTANNDDTASAGEAPNESAAGSQAEDGDESPPSVTREEAPPNVPPSWAKPKDETASPGTPYEDSTLGAQQEWPLDEDKTPSASTWSWDNTDPSEAATETEIPRWEITSRTEGVEEVFEEVETDTSDVIPDWSMARVKVRFFVVKDGAIDHKDQIGPPIRVVGKDAMNIYMKQVSKLRLGRAHHFATLGEYMHNLNKQQKLADVIVRVNDQIFAANRHVLSCHSHFFLKLFMESTVPPYAVTDITLNDIPSDAFGLFIHFIHIGDVHLTPKNASQLLNLSIQLESDTLRAQILVYLSKQASFTLENAILILNNPNKIERKPEALATIIYTFKEILAHPFYLQHVELEDFKEIINSEYVNINTELDVFWAVVYWKVCNQKEHEESIRELMKLVRFSCMSTMELMDCARAAKVIGLSQYCQDLFVQANWISYVREKGIRDPLKVETQPCRIIFQDSNPYETSVYEFDMRYLLYQRMVRYFESSRAKNAAARGKIMQEIKSKAKTVRFAEEVEYKTFTPVEEEDEEVEDEEIEEGLDDIDVYSSTSSMSLGSDMSLGNFTDLSEFEQEMENIESEMPVAEDATSAESVTSVTPVAEEPPPDELVTPKPEANEKKPSEVKKQKTFGHFAKSFLPSGLRMTSRKTNKDEAAERASTKKDNLDASSKKQKDNRQNKAHESPRSSVDESSAKHSEPDKDKAGTEDETESRPDQADNANESNYLWYQLIDSIGAKDVNSQNAEDKSDRSSVESGSDITTHRVVSPTQSDTITSASDPPTRSVVIPRKEDPSMHTGDRSENFREDDSTNDLVNFETSVEATQSDHVNTRESGDSPCLLDSPDVEMRLIPGPLLQPELAQSQDALLGVLKRRLLS